MRTACGLLLACLGAASPPTPAPRTIKVPTWVEGNPQLTPRDFTARQQGNDCRVVAVQGPGDELVLLLVLDFAGDLAYIEPAKEALAAELPRLPANAYVGLLRTQDGLRVLLDPTPDRNPVIAGIREMGVAARAGLLDSVETAERIADSMLSKASVRVAVLYVTDSDVQNYREDFSNPVINSSDSHDLSRRFPETLVREKISKLSADLGERQAPLFIVHTRYRSDRLNEAYQAGLKQLADVTGGAAHFCRSDAEIGDTVRRALDSITSYYSVTVALPARPARNFQLQLESGAGKALNYRARFVLKGR